MQTTSTPSIVVVAAAAAAAVQTIPFLLFLSLFIISSSSSSSSNEVQAFPMIPINRIKSSSSSPPQLNFPIKPFTSPLSLNNRSSEVTILQMLLMRYPACYSHYGRNESEFISGIFTLPTLECLVQFMASHHLQKEQYLTPETAQKLLDLYMNDKYIDEYVDINNSKWIMNRSLPSPYKYYVHVPVYGNRSIETICRLFDKVGNLYHEFRCRTHGQEELNQLTSDGSTPTGLYTFDLNTPEPDPKEYGPYDFMGVEEDDIVFRLDGMVVVIIFSVSC